MATIKEAYMNFELAKLLTEKGFDPLPLDKEFIPCMYDENGNVHWGMYDSSWYWRITHQTATKWLREAHSIDIVIEISNPSAKNRKYYCIIWDKNCNSSILDLFDTYENALEAAIKYCLENLI